MTSHRTLLRLMLLGAILLIGYWPALQGDFLWDDDKYVSENLPLRDLPGLKRIWTDPRATPQYYPLVFTTFWIEYQLWGLSPTPHHVTNVLLHALTAFLVWRVLHKLEVPGAWLAACVFALHPVHVESVAWISERKNVLSGLFYAAATLAYLSALPSWRKTGRLPQPTRSIHLREPAGMSSRDANDRVSDIDRLPPDSAPRYVLMLILYAVALLSKSVACTWPAAMLLVLWWKHGRIGRRDVLLLSPTFVMSALAGFVTYRLEQSHVGAEQLAWSLSPLEHVLLASRICWFYFWKLLWPTELIFIYPQWHVSADDPWQYVCPIGLLLVVGAGVLLRRRIGRGMAAAALFFVGTLAPALGFFRVYPMRFSYVADHFQYMASLGPIVGLVAAIVLAGQSLQRSGIAGVAAPRAARVRALLLRVLGTGLIFTLGVRTWARATTYVNAEVLWRDTLNKNPSAWIAHNNLAMILYDRGAIEEAAAHLRRALELDPRCIEARNNLATILAEQGNLSEARRQLQRVLELEPRYAEALYNLANVDLKEGQFDAAQRRFRALMELRPYDADARFGLASVLIRSGRRDEAAAELHRLLELFPGHVGAGRALARLEEQSALPH